MDDFVGFDSVAPSGAAVSMEPGFSFCFDGLATRAVSAILPSGAPFVAVDGTNAVFHPSQPRFADAIDATNINAPKNRRRYTGAAPREGFVIDHGGEEVEAAHASQDALAQQLQRMMSMARAACRKVDERRAAVINAIAAKHKGRKLRTNIPVQYLLTLAKTKEEVPETVWQLAVEKVFETVTVSIVQTRGQAAAAAAAMLADTTQTSTDNIDDQPREPTTKKKARRDTAAASEPTNAGGGGNDDEDESEVLAIVRKVVAETSGATANATAAASAMATAAAASAAAAGLQATDGERVVTTVTQMSDGTLRYEQSRPPMSEQTKRDQQFVYAGNVIGALHPEILPTDPTALDLRITEFCARFAKNEHHRDDFKRQMRRWRETKARGELTLHVDHGTDYLECVTYVVSEAFASKGLLESVAEFRQQMMAVREAERWSVAKTVEIAEAIMRKKAEAKPRQQQQPQQNNNSYSRGGRGYQNRGGYRGRGGNNNNNWEPKQEDGDQSSNNNNSRGRGRGGFRGRH